MQSRVTGGWKKREDKEGPGVWNSKPAKSILRSDVNTQTEANI